MSFCNLKPWFYAKYSKQNVYLTIRHAQKLIKKMKKYIGGKKKLPYSLAAYKAISITKANFYGTHNRSQLNYK